LRRRARPQNRRAHPREERTRRADVYPADMTRISAFLLCGLLAFGVVASGCTDSEGARIALPDSSALVETPAPRPRLVSSDSGAIAMPTLMQRILVKRDSLWRRALDVHYDAIVFDGHADTPTLMLEEGYRFGDRHHARESHVDLPRMFEGGLDAVFMSLYVPPGYGEGPAARKRITDMMTVIERQVREQPDSVAIARSPADVVRITRSGRKAVLLGLEGGHAIGASDSILADLYARGVRYVTLTHINSNSWADASQGVNRWNGLNDRGRALVRTMNDLGMLVDLSHTSDSTFFDAIAVSRAPVVLSHSSARALTPNVRNASDDMLRALAQNGGVALITFFDGMVNPALDEAVMRDVMGRMGSSLTHLWNTVYAVKRERGLPGATLEHVVDHIDHAVRIAGIDHVGLGSDFDGVFDLPGGLEDVTRLPWITYELVRRGYSDEDIRKILGGNLLRVMEEVERARTDERAAAR
jgi:membrane dipeptidase